MSPDASDEERKAKEKAYRQAYYQANRERILANHKASQTPERKAKRKAYTQAYYQANKERIRLEHQAFREANKERINAAKRKQARLHRKYYPDAAKAYREANRQKIRDTQNRRRAKNREQVNARKKAWRDASIEARRVKEKAYRMATKEKYKAKMKAWYLANRERVLRQKRLDKLAKKYNLTPAQFETMLTACDNRCECCRITFSSIVKERPCVDHKHGTTIARGILCIRCNFLIGHAGDNPDILRAAARYLEKAKQRNSSPAT